MNNSRNKILCLCMTAMIAVFMLPGYNITGQLSAETETVKKKAEIINKTRGRTARKAAEKAPDKAVKKSEKKTSKKTVRKTTGRKRVKKFALNFKDVEISEFLNIMSQLIGKNIVTDEKVRGKITISSAKKVPVSEAFDIMKSILEVKGLAVVETGSLIKVIPIKEAIRKNVEIIVDGKKKDMTLKQDRTITFILGIEHAEAAEIASALKSLKSKFTDIVVYQPLNIIIFSGTATEIDGLIKISRALDRQALGEEGDMPRHGGNIHVVHLENASAEELAEVLSRIPFSETAKINTAPITKRTVRNSRKTSRVTGTQATKSSQKQKFSIIANRDTNSLIITATPDEFREIRRIIRELDIVREQVLIEALIIEVSADNGWGFGIDWMLGGQSGSHMFGGSSIMGTPPNYSSPPGLEDKKVALPLASGFQLGYLSDTAILGYALLNATGSDRNFNILSTPQILTVDNQEAELNVGEEIPVATNNRISESGTQFYTYDYKPVGIKLKITPHITKKQHITMDLYQEVNSVLGQTTDPTVPPKLGKRDIKTRVTVFDGKTVVVGGLISNNKTVEEVKVPVLGDIPLLGWFFKRKTVEYSKTNLLVFITPHIVTRKEKLESITRQKRKVQDRLKNQ